MIGNGRYAGEVTEQQANTAAPKPRRRGGWLTTAAIAALGLSIAALVIALTDDNGKTTATNTASANASTCSTAAVAKQQLPSVVTIQVAAGQTGGTGSGEVINTKGDILTNNHVIAAAASGGAIRVLFSDGQVQTAKIVGRDPETDLAVLQVPDGSKLPPIQFGSSADLQVGQPVIALGAPLGLASTVTTGIVSALDRSVDVPAEGDISATLVAAIQTDAAINPGNSGGALVNCAGQLVGIPSAGATVPSPEGGSSAGSIGIGFAIPSDFAKTIANELISTGKATHGSFGVSVMTAASGPEPGSPPAGLYVADVTAGGPAATAGIRVGDLITEIGGTPATSAEQLLNATLENRPGQTVQLTYQRQGTQQQATVTLGSR
jgi:putative serine protease PepD